jgi:3-polyprenyl-4-hydroxybenzoate decarboxylase
LERVDWTRDLHFHTRTTIDTLDYSGTDINSGSKVVIAAAGEKKRELGTSLPTEFTLPQGFSDPKIAMPGVLVIQVGKLASWLLESLEAISKNFGLRIRDFISVNRSLPITATSPQKH